MTTTRHSTTAKRHKTRKHLQKDAQKYYKDAQNYHNKWKTPTKSKEMQIEKEMKRFKAAT